MQDPLTTEEKDQLFAHFREEWERKYAQALRSGAMSEDYAKPGDHRLAKYVFIITAEGFTPFDNGNRRDLKNLRAFI